MDSILLEIGSEEIPAGYIQPALDAMASALQKKLETARVSHGAITQFGTPRRLAIIVADVAPKQAALSSEILGPPVTIGKDTGGNLTMAGIKFAEKVGVAPERLKVAKTPKGNYLSARKTERGLATRTVLKTLLPEIILSVPFPKSMRWADLDITFARPIHTIVALFGKSVVNFTVGSVRSGRFTRGHYFMHNKRLKIDAPADYISRLKTAHVIADIDERRRMVAERVTAAAKSAGGTVLPDEELIDIVTNLVENPFPSVGHFEDAFLEIPKEILITAMREHQKYFAVVDAGGNLLPSFIAVNNTKTRDMALVATGHERVLRARLSDARFFYQSDVKISAEQRVEKLKGVLFLAKLGSMFNKTERIGRMGAYLADTLGAAGMPIKPGVQRAARLCKSDLVSHAVVEFTKLQGVMGRVYAQVAGEPPEVSAAIEGHYRPTYSGGPLPGNLTGALVSIADKIDSICGCFSVGLVPTGAADPYALRRQAIGITQIMNANKLSLSLRGMIRHALAPFAENATQDAAEAEAQIYDFFKRRMERMLAEEGFSKDVIAAVTTVGVDHVPNTWKRVKALESLKSAADFEPLAIAFKRVVNIIRKADTAALAPVDASLFQETSESVLHAALLAVSKKVADSLAREDFDRALHEMVALRSPVDAFFDQAMVMAEDPALRNNRLALLSDIAGLFGAVADFSMISA
ncbi:MAG: glycine--tRNA ligase subunit beta [Pseudomonadota bacterium]